MKLLIFDWDGTVMDSSARIVSSMRAGAAEIALEVPSEDAVRDIIGLGLSEAIDILVPGISARDNQRLAQAYAKHYRDLDKTPTPLYPQVRETLTNLKSKGYQLAVATGKSRAGIDR
ncbi:MAG: HAD hydrolase-like protein, partial [Pseudomonadales bacterium]